MGRFRLDTALNLIDHVQRKGEMQIHDVEQNTQEWLDIRCGIPTASQFSRILTPAGNLSGASEGYLNELIYDRYVGAVESDKSLFMARGTALEPIAVAFWELLHSVDTTKVGFVTTADDAGMVIAGSSPDRFVERSGGLEIKCPGGAAHVGYMRNGPNKFHCQVQGNLWVTEREWWDVVSFDGDVETGKQGLPFASQRFERDEPFIQKLSRAVEVFADRLESEWDHWLEKLEERGSSWWEKRISAQAARVA